jgi:hypothetical protein
MSAIYVYPREFERCVDLLARKLEETAAWAGVPDCECTDLEATVALPPVARSRAEALLNGIQLQAADDFPAMAFAAKYIVKLAHQIWESAPVSIVALARGVDEGSSAR